jgi:integrase
MTTDMANSNGARFGGPRPFPGPAGSTYDVRIWKIGKARSKARPHMLRWVVAGNVKTETFATAALADSRRSELMQAMRRGESFDVDTGLPESMFRANQQSRSWFEFCRSYVAARWGSAAAKTRDSTTDALATVTLAMIARTDGRPGNEILRRAFRWAMVPANAERKAPEEFAFTLRWLERSTLPVSALMHPDTLDAVLHMLAHKLDGKPAAGDTARRRRRGLNAAIEYAVGTGELATNPLTRRRVKRTSSSERVDPRVVVNGKQARELLAAVSYVGSWDRGRGRRLVAFYAVLYYAGLRPAEAVALREWNCHLPRRGWGRLTLSRTRPVAGKRWTDSGENHDDRGLKGRDPDEERSVPIPPVLVKYLREHIDEFGTASDGRVFRNERGGLLGSSTYSRVWEEARQVALPPRKRASPLAGRPYDLRHAAITLWLNNGVPVADIAGRVGNSTEIIHRRYEGCMDGREDAINKRIERALTDED